MGGQVVRIDVGNLYEFFNGINGGMGGEAVGGGKENGKHSPSAVNRIRYPQLESEIEYRPPSLIGRVYKISRSSNTVEMALR